MRKFLMIAALAAVPTAGAAFENKAECLEKLSFYTMRADMNERALPAEASDILNTPEAPNADTEAALEAFREIADSRAKLRDALFNICARY